MFEFFWGFVVNNRLNDFFLFIYEYYRGKVYLAM